MSDQEGNAGGAMQKMEGCTPTQYGAIKKGGYCMLKGNPCKVIDYSTAKPGKHGSAKATIVGTDIFTGKKYEDGGPTSGGCYTPDVTKYELQCVGVDEQGYASLLEEDGNVKQDLKIEDEELRQKVSDLVAADEEVYVIIISACKREKIIEYKNK